MKWLLVLRVALCLCLIWLGGVVWVSWSAAAGGALTPPCASRAVMRLPSHAALL